MKVLRYRYSLPELPNFSINSTQSSWVDLGDQNLIVGRNAAGKSRLISILASLPSIFLDPGMHFGVREIEFLDGDGNKLMYRYEGIITNQNGNRIKETLTRNEFTLLDRDGAVATLYSETSKSETMISPPTDVPVIRVRRDQEEFPYFEDLIKWATGVYFHRFGHIHAHDSFEPGIGRRKQIRAYGDFFNEALGLIGTKKSEILEDFNSLGYDVKNIEIKKEGDENILYIKEENFEHAIRQSSLSQGMYRSLAILIYLSYLIETKGATLILIDDLGEGLDFERSSLLGKLIFKKCKEKKVQLISTTNDFFLMNCVEIENWNIVQRTPDGIKSYNYHNSKKLFDDFHLTGLNNFQFFATDFYNK